MFGKFLLTIAVIALIGFGIRAVARSISRAASGPGGPRPGPETQTMVECPVCHLWQPSQSVKPCGRQSCPY